MPLVRGAQQSFLFSRQYKASPCAKSKFEDVFVEAALADLLSQFARTNVARFDQDIGDRDRAVTMVILELVPLVVTILAVDIVRGLNLPIRQRRAGCDDLES
jgi:hypothetical protein